MTRRGLGLLAGSVAAFVLLLGAGPASGAVTVGSDLESEADGGRSCLVINPSGSCTWAIDSLDSEHRAAGGDFISVDGVLVRWRLRTASGSGGGSVRLRVLDSNTAVGASAEVPVPTVEGTHEFPTRISVHLGDRLGLDYVSAGTLFAFAEGGAIDFWDPRLGDAETLDPDSTSVDQLLLNADIEPDADGDGFGDETQDGCPTSAATQAPCGGPPQPPIPPTPDVPECRGKTATIVGDDIAETLRGTSKADVIYADSGNDTVKAGGGNDIVCGGDGKDTLSGGGGRDKLYGAGSKDRLKGGGGKDTCIGGPGRDTAADSCERAT